MFASQGAPTVLTTPVEEREEKNLSICKLYYPKVSKQNI